MPSRNIPSARAVVAELRRLADRIEAELPEPRRAPDDDGDDQDDDDPPPLRLLRGTGATAAAIAITQWVDQPITAVLNLGA